MQRIGAEDKSEKHQKMLVRIMAIFMLLLMVGSAAGFAFLSHGSIGGNEDAGSDYPSPAGNFDNLGNPIPSNNVNTNPGTPASGGTIDFGGRQVYVTYAQSSVSDIDVEIIRTAQDYSGNALYIQSNNSGITQEIASTLGQYSSRIQPACHGSCEEDLPEISCGQNETSNLIVWRQGKESNVYEENNCVFIDGDLRAVDAFLYSVFGQQ